LSHAIEGTALLIAIAGAVGISLGLLAGIYLAEYSREWWLAGPVRFVADVLAGETAPLLFTALGSRLLTRNPNQPFPSLTVQIFTYATGPYPEQKRLAWAGILVLISLIFVLNLAIRCIARKPRIAN